MKNNLPIRKFSQTELENWKQSIFDIYDRMRTKSKKPYDVSYGGLSLTVFPNVYAPEFFNDSLWYARQLKEIVGNKSLLEIGTGTGVIAIFCAKNGADVVATDLTKEAVENARLNAMRHGLDISVREGNLYEPIHPDEKFDFIFWAHPFNSWDMPVEDPLLKTGVDPNYESLRGYISGAKEHLTPAGKLLLGTGDSADLETVDTIANENGYKMVLIREEERPLEQGSEEKLKNLIYEFVPYEK